MSTPSKGPKVPVLSAPGATGMGPTLAPYPPTPTPAPTPGKKGGKKRSPRAPLCTQRRFLVLFFAQALLVCVYLTPPHLGTTTKSRREAAARLRAAMSEGATSAGATSAGADMAGSAVEDPEVQMQRRWRRGARRRLRGAAARPPGTKPAMSAGTTPSLALEEKRTAKGPSPSTGLRLSGNATSNQTGVEEGDSIPEDLPTTTPPLARKPDTSLNATTATATTATTATTTTTTATPQGGTAGDFKGETSADSKGEPVGDLNLRQRESLPASLPRVQLGHRRLAHWASSPSHPWPPLSPLSSELQALNRAPPRNRDLFPVLAPDRVVVVLYVHRRVDYLRRALQGLSRMEGVNETLLIVSHDGRFPEVEALVGGITFCQVKQIHAPYSPHLFPSSFPGPSKGDCRGHATPHAAPPGCDGQADQYGNFREPNKTAIKHHWWWLMNTVWDGLEETRGFDGHMLFLEEDILVAPVAYQHIKALARAKALRCLSCVAASLAPSRAHFLGDFTQKSFVRDAMGNVGYAFNRSVWERIHAQAEAFCFFDDYNWDSSLARAVFDTWPSADALRWSRASAVHIGACGAHVNLSVHGKKPPTLSGGSLDKGCDDADAIPAQVLEGLRGYSFRIPTGAEHGSDEFPVASFPRNRSEGAFEGWGGWGDYRDQGLCELFALRPGPTQGNALLTARSEQTSVLTSVQ